MERNAGNKLGIYLHIPFCVQKCNYCDFQSFPGRGPEEQERYMEALSREIAEYRSEKSSSENEDIDINKYSVNSIFFGGGTPSLLEPQLISRVFEELKSVFSVEDGAEITLEANPGTLDSGKLEAYREMGINRLSIGVQSFSDEILQFLGRIHDRRTAVENIRQARNAGFDNLNLDLMFGIPGQGLSQWEETLQEALDLAPEHLSFYSLQIEEGTPFYRWFAAGEMEQPSQELDRAMYHGALKRLEERGYRRYEISNAAKPGFECRHNLKYWSMKDYLGLGLSAHSYIRGVRFFNTSQMDTYLAGDHLADVHRNDRQDSISDYLFTELRRAEGILLSDFELRYGQPLSELFGPEIRRFVQEGMLFCDGEILCFTERGLDFTNTVLRELMGNTGGAK